MSLLKRALTSITRRKLKSLILLLIVLILGNIMLSTLLIVQSVDGTKESILRELPPVVSLDLNYEKLEEFYQNQEETEEFEIPWITFDDLERIEAAGGAYIKTFDYSSIAGIESKSLEPYNMNLEGYMIGGPGEVNYFMLQGVNNSNFALLELGDAAIIEGRTFTNEEIKNGSPVLLISKDLAETNNYLVGDTIVIESLFTDYTDQGEQQVIETVELEFELIGLLVYRELPRADKQKGFSEEDHMLDQLNRTLFTSNHFVEDYTEKSMAIMLPYYEEKYGEQMSNNQYNPLAGRPIVYILNSSEEVNKFVQRAQAALNNEYYQFVTQEDNYKKVAEPLESMKGILTYAFYITVGSAVFVLTLVLFSFMRDRQKEIGIYLALGERKSKITAQMIIETVAVGLLGATLAVAGGMFVASFISDMLITAPQVDPHGVIITSSMNSYLSNFDYDSILQNYQVGLTLMSVVSFYITITATIIAAQLIASIYILKSDPKKILM
ncbi:MAG: ABC transporter permease [Bacillota bacterium]